MEDSGIKGIGQGFISAKGQLKSKREIQVEDAKQAQTQSKAKETEIVTGDKVSNALAPVRTRFNEQANEVISAVNVNSQNLKEAQKLTKQQIETAKELKSALKDKDTEAIALKREELNKLAEQREALARQVKQDNAEQSDLRRRNLSFGNEQKGVVEVKEVKIQSRSTAADDLKNSGDVNDFIEGLKTELQSVKDQQQAQKDTKTQVKGVLQEVDATLNSIESDSIRSIDEAVKRTSKLAEDLSSSSQALVNNLSVSSVQKLLSS
ncbi:MAG: hypothetical protein K1X83_04805 [Oligoflexia bacterium]|nr:hypothetical protein [Oligoflexia bacterium]